MNEADSWALLVESESEGGIPVMDFICFVFSF